MRTWIDRAAGVLMVAGAVLIFALAFILLAYGIGQCGSFDTLQGDRTYNGYDAAEYGMGGNPAYHQGPLGTPYDYEALKERQVPSQEVRPHGTYLQENGGPLRQPLLDLREATEDLSLERGPRP